MLSMRQAFADALKRGELDESLTDKVSESLSKQPAQRKPRTKDPVRLYERQLKKSAFVGLGNLRPCGHTDWRPGGPALADGKPCRVKWGLVDGEERLVVVIYDQHRVTVTGSQKTSPLGVVPVAKLEPCNCMGYIHTRGCKPR